MRMADMYAMCGREFPPKYDPDELLYVPHVPLDATEAHAMMQTFTIFTDATKPGEMHRIYAGYTDAELMRGRPGVRVR
jgi:hypothetical protein